MVLAYFDAILCLTYESLALSYSYPGIASADSTESILASRILCTAAYTSLEDVKRAAFTPDRETSHELYVGLAYALTMGAGVPRSISSLSARHRSLTFSWEK